MKSAGAEKHFCPPPALVLFQVPFPMGASVRSKSTKTRTGMNDENHSESSAYISNGDEYSSGDSSSRSSKDAD